MTLKVDTSEYIRSHGHAPRCPVGTKIGLWIFNLGRTQGRFGTSWTEFEVTGSYSAAKRQAISEARSLGCDKITVGP